jgi:hypothetical protein
VEDRVGVKVRAEVEYWLKPRPAILVDDRSAVLCHQQNFIF